LKDFSLLAQNGICFAAYLDGAVCDRLVGSVLWGLIMDLIARQEGRRRDGLSFGFPLTDSQGHFIEADRRRVPDRRRSAYGFVDLKAVLSKSGGPTPMRLISMSLIVTINLVFVLIAYALIVAIQS